MPAHAPQDPSVEDPRKRARFRKVYIRLRIPRLKAEIAAVASRKKDMKDSGGEVSKEVIEERIYSNQHLALLRKELQGLEEERKAVFQRLKETRPKETRPKETRPKETRPKETRPKKTA